MLPAPALDRSQGDPADALVGMTSAVAIFTVTSTLFPELKLETLAYDKIQFLRLVAVGVLSGYAGIRLLNPMTRKLAEQIASDKAIEAGRGVQSQNAELVINTKDGDRRLSDYDRQRDDWFAAGKYDDAARQLKDAEHRYQTALAISPAEEERAKHDLDFASLAGKKAAFDAL